MTPKYSLNRNYYAVIFGTVLLCQGIVLIFSKTWLLDFIIPSFVLKPNTTIEEFWRKYPVEVPTRVYIFNWTNSKEVFDKGAKPQFEELGPYEFLQNMEKVNIVWNDNNTVTYNQVRTWRADEEHANASLSDVVTTVNIIALSIAHKTRYWNYWTKTTISSLLTTTATRDMTTTAGKLLLEGMDDFLYDMVNQFSFLAPEIPKFDKFAFLLMRNGSTSFEGVYNMANGIEGDFEIHNWNYDKETPYYDSPCSKVHGTTGEINSPKQSRDQIGIFYADACRNLLFEYEGDVVLDGIAGYKYSVGNKILDNGTLLPENKCYCVGECMPSGMLNVSACRYGLPLFLSLPNYYNGDPVYLNAVEGLRPQKEKHETYIVLEPRTGIPLKAVLRIQLNFLLHAIEDIDMYQDVPEIYFPVLWLEVEINLPDHLAPMLKMLLIFPFIFKVASIVLITIGMCLLIAAVVSKLYSIFLYNKLYKEQQFPPLKPEEIPLQEDGLPGKHGIVKDNHA